jgi:hypothetical protein
MPRSASLPFTLKRSQDVLGASFITTTTELIHGLLRLDGDRVVIQWRLGRKTEHIGGEIRTDREYEAVREVVVPLEAVAGATVRRRWWERFGAPKLVLTGADLQAFEEVAGEDGLRFEHPAELVVRVRRRDRMLAEEFAAELVLAVAERSLERHQERALARGARKDLPQGRDSDGDSTSESESS